MEPGAGQIECNLDLFDRALAQIVKIARRC